MSGFLPSVPATSGSLFDPATMALLGMAGGFANAAMPQRTKIPLGAVIGMGAQGLGQGLQQAVQGQTAQQDLQTKQLSNQLLQAQMPAKTALLNSILGGSGGGMPFGAPQMGAGLPGQTQGQTQGQMGAAPGGAPNYLTSPNDLAMMGRFALATGNDRAAAALFGLPQTMAGGAGFAMGTNGTSFAVPGGSKDPRTIYTDAQAEAGGKVGPALAQRQGEADIAVNQAGRTPGGYAPGTTITTPNQIQQQNQLQRGGNPQGFTPTPFDPNDGPTKAALSSIPTPYQPMVVAAAQKYGVPVSYIAATMQAENDKFNPVARSKAGAIGMMQVMPGSATPGVDLTNPTQNIMEGTRILQQNLVRANGDYGAASAGYNAGPAAETPTYLRNISSNLNRFGFRPQAQGATYGGPPAGDGPAVVQGSPQTREAEAEGTRLAGLPTEINTQAAESQTALNRITQAEQATKAAAAAGINSGYFSPELAQAVAAAKSLGINLNTVMDIKPEAIANAQLANEAEVQINGLIMKRLFPQRVTNLDMNTVGKSLMNFGMDPAAISNNLGLFRQMAQYDVDKANSMNAYRAAHGTLQGWEPHFYQQSGYGPAIRNAFVTPEQAAPGAGSPSPAQPQAAFQGAQSPQQSAQAAPPPQLSVVAHPQSQADFAVLPHGARFVNPRDGKIMVKN